MIRHEYYDFWSAWSLNLPRLRIVLIIQQLRYWEWKPRKCRVWKADHPKGEWSGWHVGPFEITWREKL